jgi:hypothetical protein
MIRRLIVRIGLFTTFIIIIIIIINQILLISPSGMFSFWILEVWILLRYVYLLRTWEEARLIPRSPPTLDNKTQETGDINWFIELYSNPRSQRLSC